MGAAGGELRRRATAYGWMPLVALAATAALEAGERQSLAQAVDGIQADFGVSDSAIGWLPFAMSLVGVVGAFPIGVLTDRLRRTTLLAIAMVVWTVCMGFNAVATGFVFLWIARMGVGAVEANGPATMSLLSDYYPVKDRARMIGLYQSGNLVGAVLGLVVGGVAVELGGWRWAFWMWVPIGLFVAAFVARQPEPRRGDHDADFEADLALAVAGGPELSHLATVRTLLPQPRRVGTLDYARARSGDVLRELLRIPSMWFGVVAITVSHMLLLALQFWAVEYFKRVHGLEAGAAGALSALLGAGSVLGILGGGFLADRYLRRGHVNARVYVVSAGSVLATVTLIPAFASTNLALTAPLFFLGGAFLTLPIAPAEALVSDVVVADLRGRAATVRSVVRALSAVGVPIIGLLSDQIGLRMALVWFTPIYAIGGLIMLGATRTYRFDVAYAMAETRRVRAGRTEDED